MKHATRVAGPALPPELLDEWHQFRGGADGHQWALGRSVADALVEYAEAYSAATLYRAAAKAAECSVSQVRKCSETYGATPDDLRADYDVLTFEHFAVLRFASDGGRRWWLRRCLDTAPTFHGRPMTAKVLARKRTRKRGKAAPSAYERGVADERARVRGLVEARRDHAKMYSHVVVLAMQNVLQEVGE